MGVGPRGLPQADLRSHLSRPWEHARFDRVRRFPLFPHEAAYRSQSGAADLLLSCSVPSRRSISRTQACSLVSPVRPTHSARSRCQSASCSAARAAYSARSVSRAAFSAC
jgi:hypothetical protein